MASRTISAYTSMNSEMFLYERVMMSSSQCSSQSSHSNLG